MGTHAQVAVLPQQDAPLRIEEIELPDPGPTQVIVKQFASGICHSQLHQMHRPRQSPVVLGHEATGVVEKVGSSGAPRRRRRSGARHLGAARRGARKSAAGTRDAAGLRWRRAVGERLHVGQLHAVRRAIRRQSRSAHAARCHVDHRLCGDDGRRRRDPHRGGEARSERRDLRRRRRGAVGRRRCADGRRESDHRRRPRRGEARIRATASAQRT